MYDKQPRLKCRHYSVNYMHTKQITNTILFFTIKLLLLPIKTQIYNTIYKLNTVQDRDSL